MGHLTQKPPLMPLSGGSYEKHERPQKGPDQSAPEWLIVRYRLDQNPAAERSGLRAVVVCRSVRAIAGLASGGQSTEHAAGRHSRNNNLEQRSQCGTNGRDRIVSSLQFQNSVELHHRGGEKRSAGNPRSVEPKNSGAERKQC